VLFGSEHQIQVLFAGHHSSFTVTLFVGGKIKILYERYYDLKYAFTPPTLT
jgi:hypothetical protein